MATYSVPAAARTPQGVSIADNRRLFNFGDRVAELEPQQSPFFTYLSKVAKKPTDDPVFKFLEQRHQWQRRNFESRTTESAKDLDADATWASLDFTCHYDKYGRSTGTTDTLPIFFGTTANSIIGQMVSFEATASGNACIVVGEITAVDSSNTTHAVVTVEVTSVIEGQTITKASGGTISGYTSVVLTDGDKGQVIGSSWAEGTDDPNGFKDELYDREGYTQIFKTAIDLFSGTLLATRHRGRPDEFRRVWAEKLKEHKMDLEQAFLFGVGRSDDAAGTQSKRHTWGIVPFTLENGTYQEFTYTGTDYDAFLTFSDTFFSPESGNSGNKLTLCSRKVMNWLNKIGTDSFLQNTVGASQYRLDIQNIKGAFGHQVTMLNTLYGNYHFIVDPLLRGPWEDYTVCIDMKNVAYRPLVGNGHNRDTYIMTNVQGNATDGRKDMILTEAGLEVSLPETHAVIKWS